MSWFSDFMGVGNSAERQALANQANILDNLALQQMEQAELLQRNMIEERAIGRESAQRHGEVANMNAMNAAAREAELTASAQQNAAQRALGVQGGSGAGALAGMKAGVNAREGAMAQAFARQQGRQDTARGQLESSQRQTRQAMNQQQQAVMNARQSAAQSKVGAEQARAGISTGARRAGDIFGHALDLGLSAAMLSDERYKDFIKPGDKIEKRSSKEKEMTLNDLVNKLVGRR